MDYSTNYQKFLLEETKLDVLAVTETHLNEKIKDDDLHIDNYCIARHDRQNSDNNWGGSLIYFRANWMVLKEKILNNSLALKPHR